MPWRLLLLCGALVLGAACDEEPVVEEPVSSAEVPAPAAVELERRPRDIYKDAFEPARAELDADSARDRLRELEREIAREMSDLR